LGVIILIGALIIFMRTIVFPVFLITTILLFIGLVVFLFIEKEDSFQEESVTYYLIIALAISFGILIISYVIGFGIGGTSIGQACTETYYAITGAEQQIAETFDNATQQLIDETCNVVDNSSCQLLKNSAKAGKTLQELTEIANSFNQLK
jgi:hypothetical protein